MTVQESSVPAFALAALVFGAGCAKPSSEGADSPAPAAGEAGNGTSNTASALSRFIMESSDFEVVIAKRASGAPGLGKTNMSIGGEPVWPPVGAGCEALIRCCDERLGQDRRYELLCPFAIIKHESDCSAALATLNQIGVELEAPRPESCRP